MAVAVRFHREDPWERLRLVRAAMPSTKLSFITSGMRFITWVPADEEVMRLAFRCVVRNGIRRFQVADPSNDPAGSAGSRMLARQEGVEEIASGYLLDQRRAHARVLRRARRCARRLRRDGPPLSEDPGGLSLRTLSRAGAALPRARPANGRSSCTVTARSALLRSLTWRGCAPAFRSCTPRSSRWRRHVEPGRRDDAPQLCGRGVFSRLTWTLSQQSPGTFAKIARDEGASARSATGIRRHLLPPPARRRMVSTTRGCSRSCAGPSFSTPCSRRSAACVPRWGTRSS